jgi:hypothetical protein
MIYYRTWAAIRQIKDLSTTERLLLNWIVGYSQARIPFNFLNPHIAEDMTIGLDTTKRAIHNLDDKNYIIIIKPGSLFRKLNWSQKTKDIVRNERRRTEEKKDSSGGKITPVEKASSGKITPVSGGKIPPVQGAKQHHSIVKNNNYTIPDGKKAQVHNKLSSGCDDSGSNGEKKRRAFRKPTPAEVTSYAGGIGYDLDGGEFCDYYESKGWLIGKSAMKDWQAAVRTWQRNSKKSEPQDESYEPTPEELENLLRGAGKL